MIKEKIIQDIDLGKVANQSKAIENTLRIACKKIAPVWSLENFVAVNPYMGHANKKFETVAQELAATGGIEMTLPTSYYLQKIKEGKMSKEDIATVLSKRKEPNAPDVEQFLQNLDDVLDDNEGAIRIITVADVATRLTTKDWNRFVTSRISSWAASYFDKGQALWAASNKEENLFLAWKEEASVDRTPELTGLKGFRKSVKALPNESMHATMVALERLGVPADGMNNYLHRLLLRMGGWSAYAARLDWENELYGGKDGKLIQFLSILICWEACLLDASIHPQMQKQWEKSCKSLSEVDVEKNLNQKLVQKLILQEAFDLAAQRKIVNKLQLNKGSLVEQKGRFKAQAVFCIDVRSEVFRRNLELTDKGIETMGFAGFFGFPINYIPIGHEHGLAQCPAPLPTGPTIMESVSDSKSLQNVVADRALHHQLHSLWRSFKSGAVTCFSFVSPMGLSYLPKLFTDSFGITRPVPHPDRAGLNKKHIAGKGVSLSESTFGSEAVGISIPDQLKMAKNALNAMSLTDNFAKYVLIVGHGATTVNNPHATGLDCGACGGHSGEANAKVAASVLNNQKVRELLKKEHISIPEDTIFVPCLHDTTTDEVSIFDQIELPNNRKEEFDELKKSLEMAGYLTRQERALRMSMNGKVNVDESVKARSKDWSQIRPEWGLAGCSAFVVAPRERTKGIDLEGKSFLHTYDWKKDTEFSILELIMTAPMVVTSWISLQYYASTVDNKTYGSGNKTLHNVTAGLGVLEGYSGDLRVGLPMQSVHDGKDYQHEPLKLNVIIEAPIEAMNNILEKHSSVQDLCDNGWINLLAMNEKGEVSHKYEGKLNWQEF